jgi:hypothetical protein
MIDIWEAIVACAIIAINAFGLGLSIGRYLR